MRASGIRHCQQAFLHIQDTRPELFADRQMPAHGRAAANFNPFHDQLGRFTTRDGAADPHGPHQRAKRIRMVNHAVDAYMRTSGTRNYRKAFLHVQSTRPGLFAGMQEPAGLAAASQHERSAQRHSGEASGQAKEAGAEKHDGKLTAGVLKQDIGAGDCLPRVMREAIAEVSKLQPDAVRARLIAQGAERYPDGSLQVGLRQLEQDIRVANPQHTYNFSSATKDDGADPREGLNPLEKYSVYSQPLTSTAQIAGHLQDGPVLVASTENGGHARLTIGVKSNGDFSVYNPLAHGGYSTIKASQIVTSPKGNLLAFALTPLASKAK